VEILNSINNLDKREAIIKAINEGVQIRWQIEESKQSIKDIAAHLKEEYEIPPAEVTKVIETIFKANLDEQKAKLEALEAVVDVVANA
jgi:hypothetical protein